MRAPTACWLSAKKAIPSPPPPFSARAWESGELYFNPEIVRGVPLSNLAGLGGFSNGEIARTSGPEFKTHRARLFLRQTWGLGGGREAEEADANQLAGALDKDRIVLTAGNFSITDVFDDNAYSHDPRTQFINWSRMSYGAYDYAADARSYSWGAALEYFHHNGWALRAGRMAMPKESNGLTMDSRIFKHYGDQIEFERSHQLAGQPGKLRALVFRNTAFMGGFDDALAYAAANGGTPALSNVRQERTKVGVGLGLEQALGENAGLFARFSQSDGKSETYAFTEIDRSLSAGVVLQGSSWGRARDSVGLAFARNEISRAHRDYLAAGGLGFFLGDGKLNYRPELVFEAFYSLNLGVNAGNKAVSHVLSGTWLSFDWQLIRNPGYNADRSPATFLGLRLHTEF